MYIKKHTVKLIFLLLVFSSIFYFTFYDVATKVYEIDSPIIHLQKFYDFSVHAQPVYNNTLVIYNRVSKCASSTTIWVARELSKENNFIVNVTDYPRMSNFFNKSQQKSYVNELASLATKTLFVRHFYFIDFNEYGASLPVYINIIRDPVDRFISRFYFSRYGFRWPKKVVDNKVLVKRNWTLEECVRGGARDCLRLEKHRSIFSYFCDGDLEKCQELTESTLRRSMKNVVQHYAVVGLQEDLSNTLAMFEAILPTFFKGSTKLLDDSPETSRTRSRNRVEPSREVKTMLRHALKWEVFFYDFIKKRFYQQLHELKKMNLLPR